MTLIAPIRPLQLCADGGYQLRLGVLGVPLIMVPDNIREKTRTINKYLSTKQKNIPVQRELVHTHIVVLVDTYLINLNMVVVEVHSFHTHT